MNFTSVGKFCKALNNAARECFARREVISMISEKDAGAIKRSFTAEDAKVIEEWFKRTGKDRYDYSDDAVNKIINIVG